MSPTSKSEKPKTNMDDFSRDDFYKYFKYLSYCGFWRHYSTNKWSRRIHNAYMIFAVSICCIFIASELLDAYSVKNDLPKLTENLCFTFITVIGGFKIIYMLRRDEAILDIHDKLSNDLFGIRSDYERLIKSRNEIDRIFRIFAVLSGPVALFMWSLPLLETGEGTLPIRIALPYVDLGKSPTYEIVYIFLCYYLANFIAYIVSVDLVFYGFFVHIVRQFDTMSGKVRNLSRKRQDEGTCEQTDRNEVALSIKEIVKHHQATLGVIDNLADYYGWPLFLQLFMGIMLITVVSLDLMKSTEVSLLRVMYRLCYVGCCYFDVLIYCYYGGLLEYKSLDFARAVYDSPWIDMNGSTKKMLMIIANQALNVPKFKTALKVPVNCHTFKNMVKLSYNFAAVFWEIEKS